MMRTHRDVATAIAWIALPLATLSGQLPSDAEALAERMLAAIGSRSAWANVSNTIHDAQQNRLDEPAVVRAVITMDFTRPRFRIETTGSNLNLVRVIDGERHWRINREGRIVPVPDDVLREDRRWYAGHVYRTLHRIASRDPALTLSLGQRGRLEVYESGTRIAWYALDVRGQPYAFGGHNDDRGVILGPWDFEQDGIRHPLWVSAPDGSWRANIKSLRINVRLDDVIFARPDSTRG